MRPGGSRWGHAIRDAMGSDVKGFVGAMDDPADWLDKNGKVVNPAKFGGGKTMGSLIDTTAVDMDSSTKRTEVTAWMVSSALRAHLQKKSRPYIRSHARGAFLPETQLPYVYRSQHAALDTARKLKDRLQGGDSFAVADELLETADTQHDLQPPLHPLCNGTALVPEDKLNAELEKERRQDAMLRMKFEIFNNRIQSRFMAGHFDAATRMDLPKCIFRFYYDGDDLTYLHTRPIWSQKAEQRRGVQGAAVGSDMDAGRLRNFQRYVRRIAQLGTPETVGDVNRMLSEQRVLEHEMRNEPHSNSDKIASLTKRRESYVQLQAKTEQQSLRETVTAEQPLVQRVTEKRRKKQLLDEAFEDAQADIDLARASMDEQRSNTKHQAFHDSREDSLINDSQPTEYLPETRRATTWLDKFTMPGTIEDPRLKNPLISLRSREEPLESELRGRDVGVWETYEGHGVPQHHKATAEKVRGVFDYKRASHRLMNGLQEKSVSDWRPSKTPEQQAFEDSSTRRGSLNRRPVSFYLRDNPDLRANKEWDDVVGAPFHDQTNNVDVNAFYRLRAACDKRKKLAAQWGLEPKPDETERERDERRAKLDERCGQATLEGSPRDMQAWVDSPHYVAKWYGKREGERRASLSDRPANYPLSKRPLKQLMKSHALQANQIKRSFTDLTPQEGAGVVANTNWIVESSETALMRMGDARVDYLASCGVVNERRGGRDPCNTYMQVQDALWELRVYRGEPEPGPQDRTYFESNVAVNLMDSRLFLRTVRLIEAEFMMTLKPEFRDEVELIPEAADDTVGWKSPSEVDRWRTSDGDKEGLALHRELTFPVDAVNHLRTQRWLAKTPWDRVAAFELASKVLNPEDDARPLDLGASYYFFRNRQHNYRLPVQRLRAYGAELREAKEISERMIPQAMARKIKNHYAVTRHSMVPYFSEHVTRNGPKFVNTPKVSFDSIGLHDDIDDYIRVNPHLTKWEAM